MSEALERGGTGPGSSQTTLGAIAQPVQEPTFNAVTIVDASIAGTVVIVPPAATAFQIGNPLNPTAGQRLTFNIVNASGGALGALTFGSLFRLSAAAITQPADGFSRRWEFDFTGLLWTEAGARTADVAN